MSPDDGQRQIPVRCGGCLGPARLEWDGKVSCPYCGRIDHLPPDELGRALELKRRVAAAAAAVQQMRGMESSLSWIFERRGAIWRISGFYFVFAFLVLGYIVVGNWQILSHAPAALRPTFFLNVVEGPLWVAGIGFAMCAGLFVGRARYRRAVRPNLIAHAPRETGLPARCRACDGDLPDRRDPLVVCEYCDTQNLVTPELARDRAGLLANEEQFYRDRSNRAVAAMTISSTRMDRVFWITTALVYALLIGVAFLASSLLPTAP
jgi:hypothetical protein